jgi:hypothetical protein
MINSKGPPTSHALRPPLFAIVFVSAAALSYEILLMRLFSIIQWHHFAFMIISLALLGYGASGTFVTIFQERLLNNYNKHFISFVTLFSVSTALCYLTAQHIQFNAAEILWEVRQLGKLLIMYLLLALPFFFAAGSIALTLRRFGEQSARIYGSDLFGAGCGSVFIITTLYLVFPDRALLAIVSLGAVAAVVALFELKIKSPPLFLALLLIPATCAFLPEKVTSPAISPYKGLSQALRIKGTRIVEQQSSPLGLISVVESPIIPWRHAPGISINAAVEPPEQLALFTDADNMTVITRFNGDYGTVAYLDQQTSALAYHLSPINRALIIGAGGGAAILQAGLHKAGQIEAVEINPQIVAIGRKNNQFSGNIFNGANTTIHIAEARGYVSRSKIRFDLIQVELLDSFNAASAGLYGLHESYLYTVEAMQLYMARLDADGYLSISRWVKVPPRDSLKLFATALAALEKNGVASPEKQLILIRGWQTSTLLIKNSPITVDETKALKNFCRTRSFDLAYFPGISSEQSNQYNVLQEHYFYQGIQALLNNRADFFKRYKFNITPSTDDRPYFFHFLKPSTIPEIFSLRGQGGLPLMEQSYVILVATLIQACLASIILIMLPLRLCKRPANQPAIVPVFIYFSSIGLGFLLLEISFMQKFLLFLHHPLFAASVILTAFLIFAGLGSACTKNLLQLNAPQKILNWAICLLIIIGVGYIPLLDYLFAALMGRPIQLKIIITILLIAPLSFCMGMPFPLAINRLNSFAPELIPWAWAVNGCASVISAVLAMLLAINFGFTMVIFTALAFYTVALFTFHVPGTDN